MAQGMGAVALGNCRVMTNSAFEALLEQIQEVALEDANPAVAREMQGLRRDARRNAEDRRREFRPAVVPETPSPFGRDARRWLPQVMVLKDAVEVREWEQGVVQIGVRYFRPGKYVLYRFPRDYGKGYPTRQQAEDAFCEWYAKQNPEREPYARGFSYGGPVEIRRIRERESREAMVRPVMPWDELDEVAETRRARFAAQWEEEKRYSRDRVAYVAQHEGVSVTRDLDLMSDLKTRGLTQDKFREMLLARTEWAKSHRVEVGEMLSVTVPVDEDTEVIRGARATLTVAPYGDLVAVEDPTHRVMRRARGFKTLGEARCFACGMSGRGVCPSTGSEFCRYLDGCGDVAETLAARARRSGLEKEIDIRSTWAGVDLAGFEVGELLDSDAEALSEFLALAGPIG